MDDELKSALDIALEKTSNVSEPTVEERLEWKYVPEGEKIAGRYLQHNTNLLEELNKFGPEAQKYVKMGASMILIRTLDLPKTELIKKTNKAIMDGLKHLKSDRVGLENVLSKLRYLLNHYTTQGEQQRQQAYEELKRDMLARMQQAVRQRTGLNQQVNIDVESQPQFREELLKIQHQLDEQYLKMLNDIKQALIKLN